MERGAALLRAGRIGAVRLVGSPGSVAAMGENRGDYLTRGIGFFLEVVKLLELLIAIFLYGYL